MTYVARVESVEKTQDGYTVGLRQRGEPYGYWLRVVMPEPPSFQQEFTVSIEPAPASALVGTSRVPGPDFSERDAMKDAGRTVRA